MENPMQFTPAGHHTFAPIQLKASLFGWPIFFQNYGARPLFPFFYKACDFFKKAQKAKKIEGTWFPQTPSVRVLRIFIAVLKQ